jgi:hypothetical protein
MSGEFAQAEKCPEPMLLPPRRQRLKEIVDLNRKLDAVAILENLSNAVRGTKIVRGDRPRYYLISYDNATMRVEVEPYSQPLEAVQSYDLAEYSDNTTGANKKNVVLVEADKVEGLKQAYPNKGLKSRSRRLGPVILPASFLRLGCGPLGVSPPRGESTHPEAFSGRPRRPACQLPGGPRGRAAVVRSLPAFLQRCHPGGGVK